MADVEFGVDVDAGYDPSIGEAYEAGGEALTYATGADAVDAALGAVRKRILGGRGGRGYVNAGARKAQGMFTYMVSMNPASTAAQVGGAGTIYTAFCNTPYQIIDLLCAGTANTFGLTTFFVGDTNMFLGATVIPIDFFFAAVQNRFVRFTTVQRGQTVTANEQNILATTPAVAVPRLMLKVRSYRRA